MSDDKQTPVPCPFCGSEWEKRGNLWWHIAPRCYWAHRAASIANQHVPAYNSACTKMRERVLMSIETPFGTHVAKCYVCGEPVVSGSDTPVCRKCWKNEREKDGAK